MRPPPTRAGARTRTPLAAPAQTAPVVTAANRPAPSVAPAVDVAARPVGGVIPPPPYPLAARRRGEQGRVLVRVVVSADGLAAAVSLVTSSGSPRLDDAALAAVRAARFTPATRNGHMVEGAAEVPIVFRLE